jgi:peptidoglycan/LPS O-acetylase OafA/YrhL
VASLLSVFGYHYTDYNWKSFLPAYNYNPAYVGSSVLQLPYVRIIHNGLPMVHIFFVISGFVLALRPLEALCGREGGERKRRKQKLTLRRRKDK